MPAPRSPKDILATELKEIHSAERQLSRAIPKMSRKIQSEALKQALERRKEQGANLIEALDEALEQMGVTKARPKNVAAEGLLEDLNEHMEEIQDPKLLDPVLLAGVQKLEHYCIAAWGTARSMGRLLGEQRVIETMERVLEEGKALDEELTRLAEEELNPAMLESGEDQEQGGRSQSKGGEARAH
jgi:ferritin-like metal-binding protein YciE